MHSGLDKNMRLIYTRTILYNLGDIYIKLNLIFELESIKTMIRHISQ